MNLQALGLAADLGGTVLSSACGTLVLVERLQGHGLPQVLVLGRRGEDLRAPLAAGATVQARGVAINLLGLLPVAGGDLAPSLEAHRRRLGALVCALDAGLPWLEGRPMLVRRLPGRIFSATPVPLAKAPMAPLEKAELKAFLADWEKGRRRLTFRQPPWQSVPERGGHEADLWPGVALPPGTTLRVPPLVLPEATALTDALRRALRESSGLAIPFLPLPADPGPLHALRTLTPEATAFRGPERAWELALEALSRLPAPPHFCARC